MLRPFTAAVAASSPSADAPKRNPALNLEIAADDTPLGRSGAGSAIGVARGDEAFPDADDEACEAMPADGTLARIPARWGTTPTDLVLAR